jgi:amino acid adenylation domain-containing protein
MTQELMSARDKLSTLSKDKAELLKLLVEKEFRQTQKLTPCPRAFREGKVRLPVSWSQQRLWFIDRLDGPSLAYYIPTAIRLRGALDVPALQRAVAALVQRHESLRTVFVTVQDEPMQEIQSESSLALEIIDMSGLSEGQRRQQVRSQQTKSARDPFDLRTGPLMRACLLRIGPAEHILLATMHHIVSDGWSIGVFIRDISELYDASHESRVTTLEPLPIQYGDYAQLQRQWLQGEALEHELSYWRSRLEGASPQLELPTDRPRPPVQSYLGKNVPVILDAQLVRELKMFAQMHEMTLFMVLYAAWVILLSRLSGQNDIVVGTPISNRRRPELEHLIGFFVNTLAIRVRTGNELSLGKFLELVKEATLGAYSHQDVPFEKVVEALQPQRSLSRNPIFQVMLVLQNTPRSEPRFSGLEATFEEAVDEPATFDLWLLLEERGNELSGYVNYAMDLFDPETVQRWIAFFKILLKGLIDPAHNLIGDLPLLPVAERERVLYGFNATEAAYPREQCVHELFEEQVHRTPGAMAVSHEGRSLTYAQLNAQANRLARYLLSEGVGPDQLVGICLERSLEMVVGVLGILKAGAAYVPLDPSYPAERLQQMLEDAAPSAVLLQERLREVLPETPARLVLVDQREAEIGNCAAENLAATDLGLSADSRVYVIYTSGSTGRPKGTQMGHRSMVNLIEWHRGQLSAQGQRVLQFAALSFDVAFQEIFSTLCTGGTLVLLDEWVRRDARALLELLRGQRVERLFVPPLMLQSLAECAQGGCEGLSLKDVITAGEQLRVTAEVVGLFRPLGGCRLHNHYGPTETHVVTALTLSGEPEQWPALPSIGRPIANSQIYVLDGQGQPVPLGVAGEIYIGGANVAQGYLHRAELEAERFLKDPFSADPKGRLYKTGDLGRWRADGTLEYLGRNDDQVKIRGYRIELGEIEAQLARHAQVREAAVVVREEVPGEKRLVAYLTGRGDQELNVEELRAHLKAALPEYMIPSAFVRLAALPLTPSGKLDRRALPAPDPQAYVSRQYEAPQGEIETALAQIWQQLLHLERVGRHDNFFELGGHSLLSIKLMSAISARLAVNITSITVFQLPTVAQLAQAVQFRQAENRAPGNLTLELEEGVI